MSVTGWKYYNHAVLPTSAPHEAPNLKPVESGEVWRLWKGALFARWTSCWDSATETCWWYCIKDTPFDINDLKAKRRYEINKGNRNFAVRVINPPEFLQQLYEVQVAAFSVYPKQYRPHLEQERSFVNFRSWNGVTIGAFLRSEDEATEGKLCGYAHVDEFFNYVNLSILKAIPTYECLGLNAALVNGVLKYYSQQLLNNRGFYITDGERPVLHKTAFPDYLEKYFGFRKAFCRLNLSYRPGVNFAVGFFYRCRKLVQRLSNFSKYFVLLNAVLEMEEIARDSR